VRRLLVFFVVLIVLSLATGCASVPHASPAAVRDVSLVELLLRDLRRPSGRIDAPVLERAADDLARALTDPALLPLDAWTELAGPQPVLVLVPPRGPLAAAVRSRIGFAAAEPARIVDQWPPPAAGGTGSRPIVVLAPAWSEGRPQPVATEVVATLRRAGYAAPAAVLVDLTEPTIAGRRTPLDIVAGSRTPAACDLVIRFTLGSRARGALLEVARIAADLGLDPERLRWERRAVVDRLRDRSAAPANGSVPSG